MEVMRDGNPNNRCSRLGFRLLRLLLKQGYRVIELDNLNDHCGPELKENRLSFIAKIRQPYIP